MKVVFGKRYKKEYKKLPIEVRQLVLNSIDDAKQAVTINDIFQCKA